jgi:protein-S-isoprenylcysteine O-methyltransferase Ste14
MAMINELEREGNWLFMRRSWLPVFLIIGGIGVMYFSDREAIQPNMGAEMIFLAVTLFGQMIRVVTVGFTPGNTSGRNTSQGQIADQLNMTGIYSLVRHPLYLGNFFMWLGPVLFLRSGWSVVVFILIYWLYYERIMFAEEQFLRKQFGDSYDKWAETVPPFIPRSFSYVSAKLPFSFRNVLKREYNGFINIFIMFTLLDLFRNLFLSGSVRLNAIWLCLFISALVIWTVIRIIHKKTGWLEVEGR